jgi:hypothetical protein
MNLWKFQDLLISRELHLSRIDQFDDRLEGTRTRPAFERGMDESMRRYMALPPDRFVVNEEVARAGALNVEQVGARLVRETVFASCWHMNDAQSPTMWETYGPDGIAIESTVLRLFNATIAPLTEPIVHVQPVIYVDHRADEMDESEPFIYKDVTYQVEQEIRAFVLDLLEQAEPPHMPADRPAFKRVRCDLKTLSVAVHLAPGTSRSEEIRLLLDEAGIGHVPVLEFEATNDRADSG